MNKILHIFWIMVVITISLILTGCGETINYEETNINGVYILEGENLTYSPVLTLDVDTFTFKIDVNTTAGGTYSVEKDKLILTVNDNLRYEFKIKEDSSLILKKDINETLKKNSKFILFGTFEEIIEEPLA